MRVVHLFCALTAALVVAILLFSGRELAIRLEGQTIRATAPALFALKNQGMAFQRASAESPDVLLLYGSSELAMGPPSARAGEFFSTEPLGFQISPVGKPGATSIVILQKVAALGPELSGRKVAISLSPSWFLVPAVEPYMYKGNFSLFAAGQLAFGQSLDFQLKQEIASRMLQFPQTLESSPILEFALQHFASGKWWDRIAIALSWPLGKLQNVILDLQDHFASMIYVLRTTKQPPPSIPQTFDWQKMIWQAGQRNSAHEKDKTETVELELLPRGGDTDFLSRINSAKEWTDLKMLLRVLRELHAKPLLLSMPLDGSFYDDAGISSKARDAYYAKIRTIAEQQGCPLIDFKDHDRDPDFLDEHHYHLTEKGWLYFDRALANFFAQSK